MAIYTGEGVEDMGYAVARFGPGGGPPIAVDALEQMPGWGISLIDFLLVVDDREAYVGGGHQISGPNYHGAYFARFDGARWIPENIRNDREYRSLARTPDGVLWLTTSCVDDSLCDSWNFEKVGQLIRRTGEHQWQRVQLRVPAGAITRGPIRPAGDGAVTDEPTFLDPELHDFGLRAVASTGATLYAIAEPNAKEVHAIGGCSCGFSTNRCYSVKSGGHADRAERHRWGQLSTGSAATLER